MQTVLMAVAIIKHEDKILIRKMDPTKNPYSQPWALFGGRLDGNGNVEDVMNIELSTRWNMKVAITERLWWDEEQKVDNDGEEKRFIYLDVLCRIVSGEARSVNPHEELLWVNIFDLGRYELNPPTEKVLKKLGYV